MKKRISINFVNLFSLILIISVFSSCVNTKKYNTAWLYKNQVIYESKLDKKGRNIILKDSVMESSIVKITEKDSIVSLVVLEGELKSDTLTINQKPHYPKGLFFPYLDTISNSNTRFIESNKLKYMQTSPVFQAITIPLKVRFAQGDVPYTASGSINIGFAVGWKFTHHVYKNFHHRGTNLYLNSKTNSFSFTPGIFFGPTIIELDRENSNLINDRDILGITGGGMIVFGINRFNIGVAVGVDHVIGNQNKSWIYSGVPWVGATIALDSIK